MEGWSQSFGNRSDEGGQVNEYLPLTHPSVGQVGSPAGGIWADLSDYATAAAGL